MNLSTPTNLKARREMVRSILVTLFLNGVLPLFIYELLRSSMTSVGALSVATLIPLLDNIYVLLKRRKPDAFAVFMLISFILGLIMVSLGGSERLLLLRESLVTAAMGLLFLGSLLCPRPLIYYFAMRFIAGNDPQRTASFSSNWKYSYFRFVMRLMTLVWGIDLLGEALVRTVLAYRLTLEQYLAISNFILYGFIGAAIVWTVYYRRYSRKKLSRFTARDGG